MNILELKGIGEKTAKLLNRLSVYTCKDLVGLYPRGYDVYEKPVFVSLIDDKHIGKMIAVEGVVAKAPDNYSASGLKIISANIRDKKGDVIKCSWFNMPFLKSTLRVGAHFVFRGQLQFKRNTFSILQPRMYTLAEYSVIENSMQPIYPLTKGLSNKTVSKAVAQALEILKNNLLPEFIPCEIRKEYSLAEHNYALTNIHFPDSMEAYIESRKRLAFEEFFLFVLAIRNMKEKNISRANRHICPNDKRTDDFISKLPFKLTGAQRRTWEEVKANMAGDTLMSRLIQGDVGSGKTIIAVLALMNTVFAGMQGAMMVPTEVLARQHFESMKELFEKYDVPVRVELLIGSMTAKQKKEAYARIKNHEVDIIVGTHAIIQEKAEYDNLGLVITDEQHRFGVNQRKALSDKGDSPHILVMSATPIPRTLAIIVYGDLDISIIDELPAERLPIKNCVVGTDYRDNAYRFIENQVREGRQVYVICPMVEESENVEAENVIDYSAKLKKLLPDSIRVDYLHGKMKASQKEEIMDRYFRHETDVLVSTTVIEVGVNVPNATVMMVENADKFGLAQLHQLRGRVGRGKYQSYCIFISGSDSKDSKKRLEILSNTNNGFVIAEEDLKQRGPGDFFGIRQSGDLRFKVGDIFSDSQTLKDAAEAATKVLSDDPFLEKENNAVLKRKVFEYTQECLENINI